MDNLVSACENVTLTRTSSDPNLNKHCQEGRTTLESSQPMSIQRTPEETPVAGSLNDGRELENCSREVQEDDVRAEPCLTTQPLPSVPHPLTLDQAPPLPVLNQALPQISSSPPSPLPQEVPDDVTSCVATTPNPPPVCNGFAHLENASRLQNSETFTEESTPLAPMDASVETLTETSSVPPVSKAISAESKRTEAVRNGELIHVKDRPAPPPAEYAKAARRLISQSQLTDLSLLGSQWDSVQGLVQSACGGAIQHGSYHGRRLANKLLRAQGGSSNGGPCCRRDPLCAPGSPVQSGWFSAVKNTSYAALCSSAASSLAMGPSFLIVLPSRADLRF